MSLTELRDALKSDKIIYGSKQTIKYLKNGKLKRVFLSSDCPDHLKNDIVHYCSLNNTPITHLKQPSDELSLTCKKNFLINVISSLS